MTRAAIPSFAAAALAGLALSLAAGGAARADAPHRKLVERCAEAARDHFGDHEARADMKYEGARADGERTVGGEIYLETRAAHVQCVFPSDARRIVSFSVDGEDRTAELRRKSGGGSGDKAAGGRAAEVTGVAGNDVLNMRSGPGTSYDIVGALANGDRVSEVECRDVDGSRWCRIRLHDEMGGEGWVNARYLTR